MPSTIGSIGSQRSGTPSRPARPKSLTPHDIETANSLAGASSQPYDYYGSEHDYREEERDTLGEFPQSRYVSMSAASTAGGFTASINEALNNAPAYNNIPLSTRPSLTDPDLPLRELSPSPLNVVKRSPSDPEPNNGESSSKPPSTPYILGIFGDPNTGIKEEPERMSVDVWQERDKAFHALSGEERRLTRPPPTRPPPAARYTTASSVYSRLLDGVTPMHQVYNPTRLATPPIDQKARQMQEDMARMAELEKKRDALGFTTSDMHGEPANHELEPPPKTYF
ncbi:hypothetical protein GLAREA_12904 [Glarea lozoyensis ATCC 20868]|uniref:Uncharacterized protein n=1 Tax=Glarea lozoyensis (strain ATCC 20868 / MF5171) TaxID=1116229 RepID=S3DDW4_GLAL2|nr:uncharacterized protein GLAREA_12904 [Glarea lozoyensis ATCC 20868]EPE30181.1 hypothetical protein GLAREA_12904 [Glarea lozoyensis ATCC 20868]